MAWPPSPGEYYPRRILERLRSLDSMTDVRSAGWTGVTAEVGVWPYNDEIVAAIAALLAPLPVAVEPEERIESSRRVRRLGFLSHPAFA